MAYTPANTNGQKTSANSAPVVLASDQGTVPVSLATAPTTPVTGTFFQATQPVSLATNTPVIAAGTATIGAVTAPGAAALALDATLTGGTARAKLTDGTNNAAVKAASVAVAATDPALVVAISPNNTVGVTASSTTGSTVPTTAFLSGVQSSTSTLIPVRSAASAGVNNGGDNELAAAAYGQFNTTFPTVTSGNYNPVQLDSSGRQIIQAPTATGAAVPANAFYVGLKDSAGSLRGLVGSGFQTSISLENGLVVSSSFSNGTSLDVARGNWNTTTGDTGAKTVSVAGATQTNYNASGATIVFNIGAVSGTTPTFTGQIQGSADSGTTWYNIPGAVTTSIVATGVYVLSVYPGATATANAAVSYPLPRTWRVNYTIGGTTPSFTITNVQVAYVL